MTTFNAKGLPTFEAADKIAATGDGLREDLNLLSASIGTEGDRAESSAKSYADTKDTANRAAWASADAAKLAEAKSYTDTKDTTNRAAWAAGLALDRDRLVNLEAVSPKVSNIALDDDGVPYYSPGSTQVHVIQDADGTPYITRFMSASVESDGTIYL